MQDAALVLRDIHAPVAPPWWPPAPGWWLLAALLVLAVIAWGWWRRRRRARRQALFALFDAALAGAGTPAEEVAAMSELLRRAARRIEPQADRLQGEAWLEFLDREAAPARRLRRPGGQQSPAPHDFTRGPGRLLLDGAYRAEVDPQAVAALRPLVQARFTRWMARR